MIIVKCNGITYTDGRKETVDEQQEKITRMQKAAADELYYQEACCKLEYAIRDFANTYVQTGRKREDLYDVDPVKTFLATILSIPDAPMSDDRVPVVCDCNQETLEIQGYFALKDGTLVDILQCPICHKVFHMKHQKKVDYPEWMCQDIGIDCEDDRAALIYVKNGILADGTPVCIYQCPKCQKLINIPVLINEKRND